jgi:hypothetical protein
VAEALIVWIFCSGVMKHGLKSIVMSNRIPRQIHTVIALYRTLIVGSSEHASFGGIQYRHEHFLEINDQLRFVHAPRRQPKQISTYL